MDERQKAIIDGHYTTYIYYLIYTLTLCAKENYVCSRRPKYTLSVCKQSTQHQIYRSIYIAVVSAPFFLIIKESTRIAGYQYLMHV